MSNFTRHSLEGRVAIITGAGSGIGKAAAKILAHEGAAVGLIDLSEKELGVIESEINKNGEKCLAIAADVSNRNDLREAFRKVQDRWGRLDIVHANAGINGVWAPIEEIKEEEWDRTLTVNLKGAFLTIQLAVPFLKMRGGSVIITSSVNGNRIFSNTGATAYSCSKAAQVALAKMLALELAQFKIRVNVICPGSIESRIDQSTERRNLESVQVAMQFPEGGVPLTHGHPGTAGQVAELVWFLASDLSNHITGTEIYIDGAQSLLQG